MCLISAIEKKDFVSWDTINTGNLKRKYWKGGGKNKRAKGFTIKHFYVLGVLVGKLCKWQFGYDLGLESGSLFLRFVGTFAF